MAAKQDRDALIAALFAQFRLTDQDASAFAAAIYDARVQACQDGYENQGDDLNIDTKDWVIPPAVLATMAQASRDAGASIVATYNSALEAQIEQRVDEYAAAHEGSLVGAEAALTGDLTQWATDRLAWKAEQIALYESSSGYSAGIANFVSDLLAGDLDLPEGVALTDLVVIVEPADAGEPVCEELVAGSPYPIDQADAVLDVFPMHPGCPHYSYVDYAANLGDD